VPDKNYDVETLKLAVGKEQLANEKKIAHCQLPTANF